MSVMCKSTPCMFRQVEHYTFLIQCITRSFQSMLFSDQFVMFSKPEIFVQKFLNPKLYILELDTYF